KRALAVTPGGVNSPVRAFGSVGGTPRFMVRGSGPYLYDADGASYVDLVCSWGPLILGHAFPAVVSAVSAALSSGTSFGAATPGEVSLAEEIVARAPVEQVRLVNSGTEATMSAVRLALSRPRGRAAGGGRVRGGDVRAAGFAGGHRCRGGGHGRVAVQRRCRFACCLRGERVRDRVRDHRGVPGEHGDRAAVAGVQRAAPVVVHVRRGLADHGRGADRVPGYVVWLVRSGRRRGRPDDVRQGDGRRAAVGGIWGSCFDHGAAGAVGAGVSGRDAVRESARDRGRPGDAAGVHAGRVRDCGRRRCYGVGTRVGRADRGGRAVPPVRR